MIAERLKTMIKTRTLFCAVASSALLFLTGCGGLGPILSSKDLNNRNIGVQTGTTGSTLASDIDGANVEEYPTAAECVDALRSKQIDAVVVDYETALRFIAQYPDIHMLNEDFADERYAIAIQLGNTRLRSQINGALRTLTEDGTLAAIKANYEGDEKGQHPYELKTGIKRDKGTLVMATNAEFPPYESEENGLLVGIDIDMMNAVCDELGYELKINDMDFNDILPNVQRGDADVGVAGLSVTPEREEIVLFTDNYAVTHQVIVVRKK